MSEVNVAEDREIFENKHHIDECYEGIENKILVIFCHCGRIRRTITGRKLHVSSSCCLIRIRNCFKVHCECPRSRPVYQR